jgi:hypothetical protein
MGFDRYLVVYGIQGDYLRQLIYCSLKYCYGTYGKIPFQFVHNDVDLNTQKAAVEKLGGKRLLPILFAGSRKSVLGLTYLADATLSLSHVQLGYKRGDYNRTLNPGCLHKLIVISKAYGKNGLQDLVNYYQKVDTRLEAEDSVVLRTMRQQVVLCKAANAYESLGDLLNDLDQFDVNPPRIDVNDKIDAATMNGLIRTCRDLPIPAYDERAKNAIDSSLLTTVEDLSLYGKPLSARVWASIAAEMAEDSIAAPPIEAETAEAGAIWGKLDGDEIDSLLW